MLSESLLTCCSFFEVVSYTIYFRCSADFSLPNSYPTSLSAVVLPESTPVICYAEYHEEDSTVTLVYILCRGVDSNIEITCNYDHDHDHDPCKNISDTYLYYRSLVLGSQSQ